MENQTLLTALVDNGLILSEAASKLRTEAEFAKRSVEDLIIERRLIEEEIFFRLKSRILKVPYKSVRAEEVSEEILGLIPDETVRNFKVMPLEKSDSLLTVGMVYPDDQKAQEALKFIAKKLRLNLGVYLINHSVWEDVVRRRFSYRSEIDSAVKFLNVSDRKSQLTSAQRVIELEKGVAVSEEAPIIKIVASVLKEAVYKKASDIHIEPLRNRVRIRFRLDGDLEEFNSLPLELHQPIVSRIKVLSELKIDETRVPQDGRFRTVIMGKDIDFRVSTFPTAVGEKAAIRVLDPSIGLKGLTELGLVQQGLAVLEKAMGRPYGMILITGPTGSGKTTTLYALLQILNKEKVNILSLEDPVEYFVEGINQSQVRPEIGYDFASGLRQILRQDPDVIMIGEVRDAETAGLAIHAALTGHIVLSTLHTNNAVGVIPRLMDMKVDSFLLPPSLNIMAAQRLVGRICQSCKKPEAASRDLAVIIEKEISKLPSSYKSKFSVEGGIYTIYRAPGCEVCHGKGVSGRVALFEVFVMTPELEEIINSGPSEHKILEEARRQGMVTLRQDGIIKALQGLVGIPDVLRETTET